MMETLAMSQWSASFVVAKVLGFVAKFHDQLEHWVENIGLWRWTVRYLLGLAVVAYFWSWAILISLFLVPMFAGLLSITTGVVRAASDKNVRVWPVSVGYGDQSLKATFEVAFIVVPAMSALLVAMAIGLLSEYAG
ncbi:MAG: hypothetical protein AAGD04_06145 [Pseudomonadota bacterium]